MIIADLDVSFTEHIDKDDPAKQSFRLHAWGTVDGVAMEWREELPIPEGEYDEDRNAVIKNLIARILASL